MSPVRHRRSLRGAEEDRRRATAAELLRGRHVLEGTLTTDARNRLVYQAEVPAAKDAAGAPRTVALDGTWRLTRDHQLTFTARSASGRPRKTVSLRGTLAEADANALTFELDRGEGQRGARAQRLTLSGRWEADARNRLTFLVARADGGEDRLTLQGGWEIGPRHALRYRYRRRTLSGRAEEHALIFDGAWDIPRAGRLAYRLLGSSASAFEFRASLGTPSLRAKEGRLVHEVGIELARGVRRTRRVTLFGTWKLHRDLSVSFEIPYRDGRIEAIRFAGGVALSPRDQLSVALRVGRGERLGLTVTFTRELVPDANLFLRVRHDDEERAVVGGVRVRF